MNVPVHVGFTILQYAKLRMLEFYYDFMDRWVLSAVSSFLLLFVFVFVLFFFLLVLL